jgi:hypothetical protein
VTPEIKEWEGVISPRLLPELYNIIVVYWLKTENND